MGTIEKLRMTEDVVLAGRAHPVISALIETLPPPGKPWPAGERTAWLEMMSTAFTLAYGQAEGQSMRPAAAVARPAPAKRQARKAATRSKQSKASRKVAAPRPPGPEFFIDQQGYARRAGGDRVLPAEVVGYLVDRRGEMGDLGAIVWADDSRGIPKGLQLDVTISG